MKKYAGYCIVLLTLIFVACDGKENKPVLPPVLPPVVDPVPAPVLDYCKAEGNKFSCMSAVYFYGKECQGGGPVYVKDLEQMQSLVESTGQAVAIKMKDESLIEIGVGMKMPCEEI